jgi:hypothetical protein
MHEMNAYRADHVSLSVRSSCRMLDSPAGRICMKLGLDVMPLVYTLKSCCSFAAIDNTNTTDYRTCEVGSTLAPFTIRPYGESFGK